MSKEHKVVVGVGAPEKPLAPTTVILGMTPESFAYMNGGLTHTFDLTKVGIQVQILLFRGDSHDAIAKTMQQGAQASGAKFVDERRAGPLPDLGIDDCQPDDAGNYTREQLIMLCERGRVPQAKWRNRDTAAAQRQMGEAWALLSAGCGFRICNTPKDVPCITDESTIWIDVTFEGFDFNDGGDVETEGFYLPTADRLAKAEGGDWY